MSKTTERELTEAECKELLDHELDTVTGGLVVNAIIVPVGVGVRGGDATPNPVEAWNQLLHQYGY